MYYNGTMKSFLLLCAVVLLLGCSVSGPAPAPNILLIVADDAGWNDVGFHNPAIITPNIDELCTNGVELDFFYVYPTCSPTRASLLTGRYASRFGITHPIAMNSTQVLPTGTITLPGLLKKLGYTTAITGKWHLGLQPESGPLQYGFDHSYGYLHGQIDQLTHEYKNGDISWHRMDRFIEEPGHATDLITDEAIAFIHSRRDKSKPFFLYVPYSVPHYPVQETDEWTKHYEHMDLPASRKLFAASMTHLDSAVGRLMASLDQENIRHHTLVIFISDNGGQLEWSPAFEYQMKHGPYSKLGDNTPLRGAKTEVYEGGIRVPAIFNWPGVLPPSRNQQLINVTDLFPTIAGICGAAGIDSLKLDGMNVWPALSGKGAIKDRVLFLRTDQSLMYRKEGWKLIHHANSTDSSARQELFDIAHDPLEQQNLIDQRPEIARLLWTGMQQQVDLEDSLKLTSFAPAEKQINTEHGL